MNIKSILIILIMGLSHNALAKDVRIKVDLPEPMREHMLANMRDHLMALETITRKLAREQYDEAADIAESRLGMSSLKSHGASHMAQFQPKQMSAIGLRMHQAASRFSVAAKDAELDGGLNKAFSALSEVMQQCVTCHSGFRVH